MPTHPDGSHGKRPKIAARPPSGPVTSFPKSPTLKVLKKSQEKGKVVTPGNPEHKRLLKIREQDIEKRRDNRRAFSAGSGTKA